MEHKCLSPWKGAIAGGLITFVWSAVSWMALPFHNQTIGMFKEPMPVLNAIAADVPGSGVYLLKNDFSGKASPSAPFVFLSYNLSGWGSMGATMTLGLLLQMIGAFFWTWILGKIPGLTLKSAALYGLFFGLSIGVLGAMPNWVWWKFPLGFSLLYVADAAIAWTAASVVIARWCQALVCELPAAGKML